MGEKNQRAVGAFGIIIKIGDELVGFVVPGKNLLDIYLIVGFAVEEILLASRQYCKAECYARKYASGIHKSQVKSE